MFELLTRQYYTAFFTVWSLCSKLDGVQMIIIVSYILFREAHGLVVGRDSAASWKLMGSNLWIDPFLPARL
jgi:hypothetical protein